LPVPARVFAWGGARFVLFRLLEDGRRLG